MQGEVSTITRENQKHIEDILQINGEWNVGFYKRRLVLTEVSLFGVF
jgi:hypothetical protein